MIEAEDRTIGRCKCPWPACGGKELTVKLSKKGLAYATRAGCCQQFGRSDHCDQVIRAEVIGRESPAATMVPDTGPPALEVKPPEKITSTKPRAKRASKPAAAISPDQAPAVVGKSKNPWDLW